MSSNLPTDRGAIFALTGETVTDETLFDCPPEEESTRHASAFRGPLEKTGDRISNDEESRARRSSMASITGSLSALRTQAHRAFKKSHKAVKKTAIVFAPSRTNDARQPDWLKAEKSLGFVNHSDADLLRDTLEVVNQNYSDGQLYFRKVHIGDYGEFVNWQVKFDHKTRGCQEQARTLKDAARKVKSYLDFKEPGDNDERFKRLYEIIRSDKRYDGSLVLFKEGKGKDYYPWKVRIDHERHGWTKVSNTLSEAIQAMEEHFEYQECTSEEQKGVIWERVFTALEKYPKCKVFFKETTEDGPDGESEKVWRIKVDHSNRGVQFEAVSRIFEEAAGQVYDYLAENKKDAAET